MRVRSGSASRSYCLDCSPSSSCIKQGSRWSANFYNCRCPGALGAFRRNVNKPMISGHHTGGATAHAASGSKWMAYDLVVAYRIYPMFSKLGQGLPFGDDKLRLAEVCLRSFRDSLGSLRVKIWAILDGCPQEYR